MNFGNIFKGVAQQAVNAALPRIKAGLIATLSQRVIAAQGLAPDAAALVLAEITSAINDWTIKL